MLILGYLAHEKPHSDKQGGNDEEVFDIRNHVRYARGRVDRGRSADRVLPRSRADHRPAAHHAAPGVDHRAGDRPAGATAVSDHGAGGTPTNSNRRGRPTYSCQHLLHPDSVL